MTKPPDPGLEWTNLVRLLDEATREQRRLRATAARAVAGGRVAAALIESLARADAYAAELADRQVELLRRIHQGNGEPEPDETPALDPDED